MQYWQILVIAGVIFIIMEIFTPAMFFLNLALACFITAVIALFVVDLNYLVPVFLAFSLLFLLFLRPLLVKNIKNGEKTGVEEKYIGKFAQVTETITANSGVITIYNERWEARSNNGGEIPAGSTVKIVRNESLILFVDKVY